MDTQTILIIVTILVAVFALYRTFKNKPEELTPVVVANTVRESVPVAKELMEIAQIATNAAEQLKREGKIRSNDIAFNYALDYIKRWVPDEWEVSNDDIIAAVNAAVLVSSGLRKDAGASSENASKAGIP
jgi:hypothetical protein